MSLSLNFTFSAPCSGGNHVPVTATLSGAINKSKTYAVDRDTVTSPPADADVQAAVEVLLRLMVVQLANKTNANIKSKIEAKTIDLTVVG